MPKKTHFEITESPADFLFADVKNEFAATRRILERVPDGKNDWRPHEKSMSLDELATHVSQLPGFGIAILTSDTTDGGAYKQPKNLTTAERVKLFDELSVQLSTLLNDLDWQRAMEIWSLTFGGNTVIKAKRMNALRGVVLAHIGHHRAQLGVYLRLLGVPLPGTYGPSADEPFGVR